MSQNSQPSGRTMSAKSAVRMSAGTLALAAAVLASPAFAQDDEKSFEGFRADVYTGYENIGVDFDDDVLDGGKRSQDGIMLGAAIGYDFQMNNFVIGFEAEIAESTAQNEFIESGSRPTINPPTPVTTNTDIESGVDLALNMRAGYVVSPSVLLYGKLGYSWKKVAIDGTGTDNGVAFSYNERVELGGLRLGAGTEVAFGSSFYGKLEYQYSNYNEGDFDINGVNANLDPIFDGIDVVSHHVLVGVGYRF